MYNRLGWRYQKMLRPLLCYASSAIVLVTIVTLSLQVQPVSATFTPERVWSPNPIRNATLGFEKIFVLNLPERTDHKDGLVLASSMSGIDMDFVAGVHGDSILDKALPVNHANDIASSAKGAWRAHINTLSFIVEHKLGSALIMEDDVDWDIRIREQLQDFARAADYVSSTSRGSGTVDIETLGRRRMASLKGKPYGENWDVLWLGHCGMYLPKESNATMVMQQDDATVAPLKDQRSHEADKWSPLHFYPPHTRVVAEHRHGVCTLAYAVSLQGARKMLYDLGINRLDKPFDLMLQDWCEKEVERPMCVGAHPPLFEHYRPPGPSDKDSDIASSKGDYRENGYTLNIRWSVRQNMQKLLRGSTDYIDQWPYDEYDEQGIIPYDDPKR